MDNDIRAWVNVLTDEIRTKNVQGVLVRRFGNRAEICFVLKDGVKYVKPSRCDQAVAWMIERRLLSRDDFFRLCPAANNSASLHHQAIARLRQKGLIEKQAGVWVWTD